MVDMATAKNDRDDADELDGKFSDARRKIDVAISLTALMEAPGVAETIVKSDGVSFAFHSFTSMALAQ